MSFQPPAESPEAVVRRQLVEAFTWTIRNNPNLDPVLLARHLLTVLDGQRWRPPAAELSQAEQAWQDAEPQLPEVAERGIAALRAEFENSRGPR